jgi:hypothetical protein
MLKWVTFSTVTTAPTKKNKTNLPDLSRACRVGGHRVDLSLPTGEAPSVRGEDGQKNKTNPNSTDLSRRSAAKTDVQTNPIFKNEK